MSKKNEREEYLICTDDTVIEMGIDSFPKALKEAETFCRAFTTLNVYVCKIICNAEEV